MGKRGPKKGEGGRPRKKAGTGAKNKDGYRRVTVGPEGKGRQEYEHRAKAGLSPGDGKVAHHKNSKRDDNRKGNLRVTSQSKNVAISNRKRGKK